MSPIEEARTYQKILELENNMTQEQLAATMGKTQSSVSNKLRLLALPEEIQDALLKEKISERHARSLLNIEDKNEQIKMMDKVIAERMTVRELDKEIKDMKAGSTSTDTNISSPADNSTNISNSVSLGNTSVSNNEPEKTIENLDDNTNNNSNVIVTSPPVVNTEPQSNESEGGNNMNIESNNEQVATNPTEVNINEIRENAQDIGGSKPPTMNVDTLMKDNNEETSTFKFVPTFNDSNDNNMNVTNDISSTPSEPIKNEENMFSGMFNANINQTKPQQDNNLNVSNIQNDIPNPQNNVSTGSESIPSNIATSNLTIGPVKDAKVAAGSIKEVVDKLKNDGYDVVINENDGLTEYKIVIEIKK